jgi:hypothetical protein
MKLLIMKNAIFWDAMPVALVRTDVSEELSASIIKVTRIGERPSEHSSDYTPFQK